MATILPDNPRGQLQFFQVRAPQWVVDPVALGLTNTQAAAVQAATAAAAAAWMRAQVAREAAQRATLDWSFAARHLREIGGEAVRTIKAFAEASGAESVYPAAGIATPGRPGPKRRDQSEQDAAVPRVRSVHARPDAFGGVVVEWTCGQGETMGAGAGMFYRVERSIDNGARVLLEVIGGPGPGRRTSRFTDTTVPTGTRTAEYFITPMRGSATGRVGPIATVRFGNGRSVEPMQTIRRAA